MGDGAPDCDDIANASCCKELSPIAVATQGALLQGKVGNLFQVGSAQDREVLACTAMIVISLTLDLC